MKIILHLLFVLLCAQAIAADKPNILIIVSDDHGYADVGFHGSTQAVTPHLDALAIGNVTAALAGTGQRGRTLIFFFSDNGGPSGGPDNTPLRGTKGTLYEGGVRVPFLVSWPAKLPAGKDFDQPVTSLDVFASALAAAGVAMPADKKYDGVNIVPHLAGEVKSPPHERLLWRMHLKQSFAIREGNWKLIRTGGQPPELYDFAADPGEHNNVAAANAEVATRLTTALEAWDKELIAPVFPGSSVKNEDWGPGGANQRNAPKKKNAKP